MAFLRRWPDVDRISRTRSSRMDSRSWLRRISRMDSAPMPASNRSGYLSFSSRYLDSDRIFRDFRSSSSLMVSCSLNSRSPSSLTIWSSRASFSARTATDSATASGSLDASRESNFSCSSVRRGSWVDWIFSFSSSTRSLSSSMISLRRSPSTDITMCWAKYRTRSKLRGERSRSRPRRLGLVLLNQMWATGAARRMWPMRSRRTLERVTSTPHRSQTTPR